MEAEPLSRRQPGSSDMSIFTVTPAPRPHGVWASPPGRRVRNRRGLDRAGAEPEYPARLSPVEWFRGGVRDVVGQDRGGDGQ